MARRLALAQAAGLAALLAVLLLAAPAAAEAEAEAAAAAAGEELPDEVLLLNTDTFADYVERQDGPALVKFIIPDCQQCLALAPDYKKVARNLKGIATVAAVDCTDIKSVRTCRSYAAHAFPKILVFKTGSRVNPYTGGTLKEYDEYKGALSARALAAAVTSQLDDSRITKAASSAQVQQLLQAQPKLAQVLLFTDRPASTVLSKGLSWALGRRLAFAEVRPAQGDEGSELMGAYGVESMPAVVVVKPDGSQEHYSGPLNAEALRQFLERFAAKEPLPDAPGSGAAGGADGAEGEVVLQPLASGNLADIDESDDMWLLAFYSAPEDGESCAPQLQSLRSLLQELQGIVSYGSVNLASAGLPAESAVQTYGLDAGALDADGCGLQLVLLPHGQDKLARGGLKRWSGGLGDAKPLQDWILAQVPDFTSLLSDEGEAQAFVAATASSLPRRRRGSGGHDADEDGAPVGKVFLFSTKHDVPGIYKALAAQFHGRSRLLFAWTSPDTAGPGVSLMQKMNVRRAPAMAILFPLPPKPLGAEGQEPAPPRKAGDMAMQVYMGPLKFQKMRAWLTAMAALTGMSSTRHAGATDGPAPADLDVRAQAQLSASCYDKPGLCVVALLDGRAGDSSALNRQRQELRDAASQLSGQPVNWVAVDVARQPSFRRAFGFEADQLPALVAVSSRRMRFAQGAPPFGAAAAKALVTRVLAGSAVTLPLPALPLLVDGGEAEDVPPPAVAGEEEFDLADVMAEEVNAHLTRGARLAQAEAELEAEAAAKKKQAASKSKKKAKGKKKSKSKQASKKDEL